MRTTKRSAYAALAVGLALTAVACGDDKGGGSKSGGTVTYAVEQEYQSYNNGAADQGLVANLNVLNMLQPGVFISQPDLTYKLWTDMMESAEVTSTDPQVVVYKIKKAAVWSDGVAIDCKDFYLQWISSNGKLQHKNPDYTGPGQKDADGNDVPEFLADFNTASTTGYENISKLECSDDGKTVTTTYDTVFADWQSLFAPLLPAHVVESKSGVADITKVDPTTSSDDSVKAGEFWNTGFSGDNAGDPTIALSGAWFVLDQWNKGQNVILKKNPKFYGTDAKLDELIFQLVPDATQQPTALQNGDVQVISPQPNTDLVKQLQGIDGVTVSLNQGTTFEHYDFNQANPHLAKLEVRKALALCIPREEIVNTLVHPINPDATVLNNRIYIPQAADYKDNSEGLKTDVEAAKKLLEGAGYTLGSDGIYEDSDGKLSLRLGRRDPNPRRQSTNELAIESCKKAGIELTDDPAENFNSERLPASDYDIALFAWQATPALASNTSIYIPDGGQNWNNYKNDQMTTLFNQANAELDPAKRADLMNQIDQVLWADMATLPLFQFQEMIAYSNKVQGVVFNGPLGVTWNANEWSISS